MIRPLLLGLAAAGLRMPIGTDLLLHEEPGPEAARLDPVRLGRVIERAARRYRTPLAFPLMDLRLEKADLLGLLGVPAAGVDGLHLTAPPEEAQIRAVEREEARPFPPGSQAQQGALRYIAEETDLVPIGMAIGPFSLLTKLLADPITPLALAAGGATAREEESVALAEAALRLSLAAVLRSVRAQIRAGARAVILCEPAVSTAYLSPRMMARAPHLLEQFVLTPLQRVRESIEGAGADLILHDCGQLTAELVRALAWKLRPAMLSLGSSRRLWEDAALLPPDTVLFGNLPTRQFYSDSAMPDEEVRRLVQELIARMRATGHPFILGSECDVLHVPDAAETIRRKVQLMLETETA
ncbi:MAG: hypothetical protein NZR01_10710 [Bryobacteraceae bacterium]|nr:hypothetical protein [Bryobacteraceae bacterium]